eukprot:COSAG01_NODE_1519_length_10043_cov_9.991854_2_plen_113_part_00
MEWHQGFLIGLPRCVCVCVCILALRGPVLAVLKKFPAAENFYSNNFSHWFLRKTPYTLCWCYTIYLLHIQMYALTLNARIKAIFSSCDETLSTYLLSPSLSFVFRSSRNAWS